MAFHPPRRTKLDGNTFMCAQELAHALAERRTQYPLTLRHDTTPGAHRQGFCMGGPWNGRQYAYHKAAVAVNIHTGAYLQEDWPLHKPLPVTHGVYTWTKWGLWVWNEITD